MKHIGIKLADGTFYPILEEGTPATEKLDVTTVKDNQTKVLIDVYRSEAGSMEDAEYVDTLEVSNLNAHPNGEPDLHLSLSIDEHNELSAEVIDGETGKKSEIQVQLVSRTLAEREASDADFALDNAVDPSEIPTIADTASDAETTTAEPSGESEAPAVDEPVADEPLDAMDVPFSFDTATIPAEEEAPAKPKDDFDIPDFNDLAAEGEADAPKHTPVSADFDLPDFGDFGADTGDTAADTLTADDGAATDTADDGAQTDDASSAPNASDDLVSDNVITDPLAGFDLPATDDGADDTSTADDTQAADTASDDFGSLDLPDFDGLSMDAPADESADPLAGANFDAAPNDAATADDAATVADTSGASAESVALAAPAAPTDDPFAGTDFAATSADSNTNSDSANAFEPDVSLDDFDLPDFGSSSGDSANSASFDDLLFDEPDAKSAGSTSERSSSKGAFATSGAPAMDFSDLYDKETLAGKASSDFDDFDEEETVHKTRVPVIICVVCAIICIIATALILFIIPSRYNLISSRKAKAQAKAAAVAEALEETKPTGVAALPESVPDPEQRVEPVAEPEKAPVAPAVEDKIVVAPSAEEVVPEPVAVQEPVPEPRKKSDDVTYRIKWGDTLWDISDAYYNNPWRYPKIADYNDIPNPDLIIAGSDIIIPAP